MANYLLADGGGHSFSPTPGGVEKRVAAVRDEMSRRGWDVLDFGDSGLIGPREEVAVYIQTQGFLSASSGGAIEGWLRKGWQVYEHNVFGLPSPWRPMHPNFTTILSSHDTAARFSFRTRIRTGRSLPYVIAHHGMSATGKRIEPMPSKSFDVGFIRIGRPDRVKWSQFEERFARRVAQAFPNLRFRLTLVGSPFAPSNRAPRNLWIESIPYSTNPFPILKQHTHMLHHSQIGETYGNVLAEAVNVGLKVISTVDFSRDCGHLDFLHRSNAVLGSAPALLGNAPGVVELSNLLPVSRPDFPSVSDYCDQIFFGDRHISSRPGNELRTHLRKMKTKIRFGHQPSPEVVQTIESLSVAKNWRSRDEGFQEN